MIDKAIFKAALALCRHSVSTDATKPHLNNVLFEFEPELLRLVSTDGHRITLVELLAADTGYTGAFPLYRPYAEKLLKTILAEKKPTGEIAVICDGMNVYFSDSTGALEVFSRPEVKYPDYRQVLREPTEPPASITLNGSFVEDAIKLFRPLQGGRSGVKIKLFNGGPNYFYPQLEPAGPVLDCFTAIMGYRS